MAEVKAKYRYPRSSDPLRLLRIASAPGRGNYYAATLAEAVRRAEELLLIVPHESRIDVVGPSGRVLRVVRRSKK